MKTIGIIQPNFLPWRGYFDFIDEVDAFVFLDDVKYTKNDWRNRNRIRTLAGQSVWLTVPVRRLGTQKIMDVETDETRDWRHQHIAILYQNYRCTPFFKTVIAMIEDEYARRSTSLTEIDVSLIRRIMQFLNIETETFLASELGIGGDRNERLIAMTVHLGGQRYLSGPAGQAYLEPDIWARRGIELAYKSYGGYSDYEQISAPFDPQVSVLDLLFMKGTDSGAYLGTARRQA